MKMRVELIATDGEILKRVAWYERRPNGFYSGVFIKNSRLYFTYHTDGNRWNTIGKDRIVLDTGQNLDSFIGIDNVHIAAFDADAFHEMPSKTFRLNKFDGVVYLDTRTFQERDINYRVDLLEPNRTELIGWGKSADIHIFTNLVPWLVISIIREDLPIRMNRDGAEVSGIANQSEKKYNFIAIGL